MFDKSEQTASIAARERWEEAWGGQRAGDRNRDTLAV